MGKFAHEPGYLEWLSLLPERDDPAGYYAKAVLDDFSSGNTFKLADSAIPGRANGWDMENFAAYCRSRKMPQEFGNVLMLGSVMALLEFNVNLLTGILPLKTRNPEAETSLRAKIADCCEILPAILHDMNSEFRGRTKNS